MTSSHNRDIFDSRKRTRTEPGDDENPFPKSSQRTLTMKPPTSPGGYLVHHGGKCLPSMHYNKPPEGMITKNQIVDSFFTALSEKFTGHTYCPVTRQYIDDERPEMRGKRVIDVIIANEVNAALRGDHDATKFLVEYTVGKPTQTNHNVNVDATQTFEDFLQEVHEEEEREKRIAEYGYDPMGEQSDVIDAEFEDVDMWDLENDLDALAEDI